MRIVIDIDDTKVKKWDGIYINHSHGDDAKEKVAAFLPGFEYTSPEDKDGAVKVIMLPFPAQPKKEEVVPEKTEKTPLSIATPSEEKNAEPIESKGEVEDPDKENDTGDDKKEPGASES